MLIDEDTYYWIGGDDIIAEGNWIWSINSDPITLNYWGPNRPDNAGASGQNCLVYRHFSDWFWDDRGCEIKYPFICQI